MWQLPVQFDIELKRTRKTFCVRFRVLILIG